MPQRRKNLYVLWARTLAVGISFSFVSPFLPLFLEEMGVTEGLEVWSSALYSAAFLSSCILSPLCRCWPSALVCVGCWGLQRRREWQSPRRKQWHIP